MDPKHLFIQATDHVAGTVACATPDKYELPTPCSEWNVQQLLLHMINEVSWVPDLVEGKTIAEVGTKYDGDLVGDEPDRSWQRALETALKAVDSANLTATAHLSYADVPVSAYISEVAADVLIHSWDLGQAVNCSVRFDPKLAQAIYDLVLPRAEEFQKSGLFGKPVPVAADADIETKLLAFYGRKNKG
jgi:uncharacterized protein (TIGR03086 family)